MKSRPVFLLAACLCLIALRTKAENISSADYSMATNTVSTGGAVLGSADYSGIAITGGIIGTAEHSTLSYLVKDGFAGQLYDVAGVVPTAAASSVNEGTTLQLGASQVLDDATFLVLAPTAASWAVKGGPIAGINASGLATANTVYQDTPATVSCSWGGFLGTLNLTVLNINSDDYGTYAEDGLPDDWQAKYFGLNNPNAAPGADADGTGQNNLFKYIAGLNPIDPSVKFTVSVQPIAGQPGQKQVVFSPVVSGRTYRVIYKPSLTEAAWMPLADALQSDNGLQRTVTDLSPAEKRFYKVQISLP